MLALLRPYYLAIAKWAGIAFAVLLVLLRVKSSGRQAEKNDNLRATVKGVKTRDKIESDVANTTDAEYERLRRKWTRND